MPAKSNNPSLSKDFICNPEDLLDRDPIILDPQNIAHQIKNSIVLITGAAGSIGSELALQVSRFRPQKLILIDQSETRLNDLDLRISHHFEKVELHSYVANITDVLRMSEIFSSHAIQFVFHAAAYKHVPFMEKHPYEAIKTNILGTEVLADLAISFQIQKFLFISTDKAVRPGSVMGATKRFAETYLQHLSTSYPAATQFIITRFGNVLGSHGSFLSTFERQIREGGPVTVTHPEVQRYFMTVSEACQLVLEANATSQGSEILCFDMGKPLSILDIAKRMIGMAGLEIGKDIQIQYIGMRPGEKLREDLFIETYKISTYHPKIRIMPFQETSPICIKMIMSQLLIALDSGIPEKMISVLKTAVPDYLSVNSDFEKLDKREAEVH